MAWRVLISKILNNRTMRVQRLHRGLLKDEEIDGYLDYLERNIGSFGVRSCYQTCRLLIGTYADEAVIPEKIDCLKPTDLFDPL